MACVWRVWRLCRVCQGKSSPLPSLSSYIMHESTQPDCHPPPSSLTSSRRMCVKPACCASGGRCTSFCSSHPAAYTYTMKRGRRKEGRDSQSSQWLHPSDLVISFALVPVSVRPSILCHRRSAPTPRNQPGRRPNTTRHKRDEHEDQATRATLTLTLTLTGDVEDAGALGAAVGVGAALVPDAVSHRLPHLLLSYHMMTRRSSSVSGVVWYGEGVV
jgi:hypothetical protein